jgi:hypothetical protein
MMQELHKGSQIHMLLFHGLGGTRVAVQ